jgi:DNA-directed RNA polymerase subunit L
MYEEERATIAEPNIEILELTKDQIKFVLHNSDLSVANALRRIIMAEVPTMAIEFVNVKGEHILHERRVHRSQTGSHPPGLVQRGPVQLPARDLLR